MRGKTFTLRTLTKAPLLAAAVALAPLTAYAAGDHGGGHGPSYGQPGKPSEVDRTIEVDATDIDFGHDKIQVQPGQTVRFRVHNSGQMQHEFTVGPPSVQREHRQEMTEMMQSGGHMDGHGHGNSVLVAPGETKELIWHFEKVEDIRFGCNVPGHYEAGMHGPFVTPN